MVLRLSMSGMVEMKSEFCGLRISLMNYVELESNYWISFSFMGICRKTGRSGFGGEFDKSGGKIENFAFIFRQFFAMSLAKNPSDKRPNSKQFGTRKFQSIKSQATYFDPTKYKVQIKYIFTYLFQ